MTQIPEKIPQQVETSALDGQEFSELDTLIVDSGSIGCTFAPTTGVLILPLSCEKKFLQFL